jgi:hypothetical protein
VAWEAELPDRKDIERSGQAPSDLVADRNAATREREHHDTVALRVLEQRSGKQLPGVGTVAKPHR